MDESMTSCKSGLLLSAFLVLGSAQAANEYPTLGLLYHTTEGSSIQHDCALKGQELHCEMTQAFVRQKLPPEKVAKRRQELLSQNRVPTNGKSSADFAKEFGKGMCEDIDGVLRALAQSTPHPKLLPEKRQEFQRMAPDEKKHMLETMELLARLCKSPNQASFDALTEHSVKTEARTCKVGSHRWTEVFQLTPNIYGSGSVTPVWTSKDSPSGPCGTVMLNRFEQVDSATGNLKFWQYISRKAITNPNGELPGIGKCSNFDEATYTYSWKSRELYLNCSIIEFSPL